MRKIARRLILALYNIDEVYYLNEDRKKISDAQKEISQEWRVPKTTVNTIVKRWEKEGLLIQTPIQGKRREMNIMLTDAGKEYAKPFMSFLYKAEDKALKKTLDKYSDEFIEVIEYFGESLKEAFEEELEAEK